MSWGLSGSNVGGSGAVGHDGYLSLARELSLNDDDTLATTFIPELTKLRIPVSEHLEAWCRLRHVGC